MTVDLAAVYEEQHARLLEGLAASIREKGLAQTQVTDIVRHARASRRTFYKHFPDKDSCLVELTTMLSVALLEQVDGAIDRDAPLAVQIDQAIDTYVDILVAEPGLTATFASPALGDRVLIAQREGIERYAQLEMEVVIRTLLRHFELIPTDARGERPSFRGVAFAPSKGGVAIVRRRREPLGVDASIEPARVQRVGAG